MIRSIVLLHSLLLLKNELLNSGMSKTSIIVQKRAPDISFVERDEFIPLHSI